MYFVYTIMKLFICLTIYATFCETHPVDRGDALFTVESTEPVLVAHQTKSTDDGELALLRSQADESHDTGLKLSLFKPAEKTRESVNLETEGIPSKVLTLYDMGQKKYFDKTQPLPLLDTISEHEKYGNNGDMFDGISRSLVNGYEVFSNLLNTLITKPQEIARSISKGITTQLDVIGGKLVGL